LVIVLIVSHVENCAFAYTLLCINNLFADPKCPSIMTQYCVKTA